MFQFKKTHVIVVVEKINKITRCKNACTGTKLVVLFCLPMNFHFNNYS